MTETALAKRTPDVERVQALGKQRGPYRHRVTEEERFWAKVDRRDPDHCWEWTATISHGYGVFFVNRYPEKHMRRAHRLAYEFVVGPIPAGMELDHLCRNRKCVNPKHLEPVTSLENWRRGHSESAINRTKTHCKRGHPFDEANTVVLKSGRQCRTCNRLRLARSRAGRSAA